MAEKLIVIGFSNTDDRFGDGGYYSNVLKGKDFICTGIEDVEVAFGRIRNKKTPEELQLLVAEFKKILESENVEEIKKFINKNKLSVLFKLLTPIHYSGGYNDGIYLRAEQKDADGDFMTTPYPLKGLASIKLIDNSEFKFNIIHKRNTL